MDTILRPLVPQYAKLGKYDGATLTVIIPCYERGVKLNRTLWSIMQTADMPYRILISEEKQSVAKNRNAALAKVDTDLIAQMDDDVILPPFWMSKMAAILERDGVGVCAVRMTSPDGTPQNDLANLKPGTIVDCTPPGTLFMYDRTVVDGCEFDEEYIGSQWEDTDFMMQVKKKGLLTVASGDVWILHDQSSVEEGSKMKELSASPYEANKALFIHKWHGGPAPKTAKAPRPKAAKTRKAKAKKAGGIR